MDAILSAEEYVRVLHCPVCESREISSFRSRTFDIHTLNQDDVKITDSAYGKIWDLSRCSACRHIFADPRPVESLIRSLYSRFQDPLYEEEAAGREKNFIPILSYLESRHPERGRLFDVGAATGILLNLARKRGWQPEGIEANPWAAGVAEEKYGLKLRVGYFESMPAPAEPFTALTMVDFIEHISDPGAAMRAAYHMLSPEGTLCVVTPNIDSLAARAAGKKWWHYRPAHLGYFTRSSLMTLLRRNGFFPLKTRRYAWTFSAGYLISRLPGLNFLVKNPRLASFWKKISIKLALGDSFEVYAAKMKK